MSQRSSIEWTDSTWNPVTGCTKISQGCKNCYAERMANRLQSMGNSRYSKGFSLTLHDDLLCIPYKWKKPRLIFVNSMSDLFHEDVSMEFIQKVFKTMNENPRHIFQILTKRSKRLVQLSQEITWSNNIWMGVSIENQSVVERADHLRVIPSQVRFLSCEPLLGPINNLNLNGIDWVIVGGESGPYARKIQSDWVESILSQCLNAGVAFFFKQWGGVRKQVTGRILNGRTYDELPLQAFHHPSADLIFSKSHAYS